MLWLECCGVNGGERSSPVLSDGWCSSASSADKVASVCHMAACYMPPYQVIKPPTPAVTEGKIEKAGDINVHGKSDGPPGHSYARYSGQAITPPPIASHIKATASAPLADERLEEVLSTRGSTNHVT